VFRTPSVFRTPEAAGRPRRALPATLLLLAALTLASACGDEPESAPPATTSATSAQQASQAIPPVPTPAELNAGLGIALDPSVPATDKTTYVEDSADDPDLVATLAEAAQANKVEITIIGVEHAGGPTMQGIADMRIDGNPVPGEATIPFVAEDGRWKLQKAWACQMLANAHAGSPSCA